MEEKENSVKEKKQKDGIKISLRIVVIIVGVVIILCACIITGVVQYYKNDGQKSNSKNYETPETKNTSERENKSNIKNDVNNYEDDNCENTENSRYIYSVDKPIIYLYPEEETEVNVKLLNYDLITCSYPKYKKEGWKVLAKPNGDLVDLKTNKSLYSLYYESDCIEKYKVEEDGFVVKGEETASFLEEKLRILGLTEREAEEFIIYWLPKLEKNNYNYIRFLSKEEIEKNMPLEIVPVPETLIRVMMTYKGLENPINVKEQNLETPERKGFVAVEWGGSEIK